MFEHKAHLVAPAKVIFDIISQRANNNGFAVERSETDLKVTAPLGRVEMSKTDTGVDMTLQAESPEKLQLFTDLYAQRFAEAGLEQALTWQKVAAKTPLNQMLTKVVSTTQISKNFMRVRLTGDFTPFTRLGAGLHFRFLFNDTGQSWPYLDHRGITAWPGGVENWHRPVYTVRRMDPAAKWVDVDIVLHDGGRATEWCRSVKPSTEIALHGPSGGSQPKASWLGLVGDETALPVILRMIEDAPAGTQGSACLFVRDPKDAQVIDTASEIDVAWVSLDQMKDLERVLRDLAPPSEDYYMFFAGENSDANRARQVFKDMGLASKNTKAASYWTA